MERRNFDREFREGTVRIVRETGKPIAQVARELGVQTLVHLLVGGEIPAHGGIVDPAQLATSQRRRRDAVPLGYITIPSRVAKQPI